jgi:hypothetical protein
MQSIVGVSSLFVGDSQQSVIPIVFDKHVVSLEGFHPTPHVDEGLELPCPFHSIMHGTHSIFFDTSQTPLSFPFGLSWHVLTCKSFSHFCN